MSALRRIRRGAKRLATTLSERVPGFGPAYRAALRYKRDLQYRALVRRSTLDPSMVVFESFVGRTYSCNPKALYEAMLRDPRFDDFTFVWAFKEPRDYADLPALGRATLVRFGSRDYYGYHARAKYWVSNSVLPFRMQPRERQVYVQTWHGTPLKRLGCDLSSDPGADAQYQVEEKHLWYQAEGRRFTALLSQSSYATERLASAFDLAAGGKLSAVVEEGYPRNDALHTFSDEDVARIRERLGLPEDKQVVLYAPTWRDDQHVKGVGYTLEPTMDFEALQRELGDTHVILFRAHYLIASSFDFAAYAGFVFDVSSADDINDFYVASDVLVTDYSSVFFDYAGLRRPMVFYMYDLERYVRGFYLELGDLPGPVVRTTDELVAAIRSADSRDAGSVERYARACDRFAGLDDGHASERVLARLVGSDGAGGSL